ncbi:MAG: type III pantothenate kinase [candidate division WOR-3 bacterium]|nr:type III pantothenate kinase [candidate division WOR-3 bacterium]
MQRILTCNIGNTNTQIANWIDNRIEKVIQIDTQHLYKGKLNLKKPDAIFTASTVPDKAEEWKRIVRNMWGLEVSFISKKIDFGVEIEYKDNLGQDRISNIAAGYLRAGNNFTVIDFGTATTVDVVIDSRYMGGLIFAGIDLGLRALHRYTSLLPRVEPKKMDKILGKGTDECLLLGAYWGEETRIRGIVDGLKKEFKQDFPVLTTGGMGEEISRELGYRYDKWLTLKGIKYIADKTSPLP